MSFSLTLGALALIYAHLIPFQRHHQVKRTVDRWWRWKRANLSK